MTFVWIKSIRRASSSWAGFALVSIYSYISAVFIYVLYALYTLYIMRKIVYCIEPQ
jgi:hypothetical protein